MELPAGARPCKSGACCWRPNCSFVHLGEGRQQKLEELAALWSSLAAWRGTTTTAAGSDSGGQWEKIRLQVDQVASDMMAIKVQVSTLVDLVVSKLQERSSGSARSADADAE